MFDLCVAPLVWEAVLSFFADAPVGKLLLFNVTTLEFQTDDFLYVEDV